MKGFDKPPYSWEQRKLGNEGTTFTGLSGKTKDDFGHGDGAFVTYMNVFKNPISDPKMVEPIDIDNSQKEIRYGDIFFTTSSETPEEVGMSSIWTEKATNTYLNSFCFGYRLNDLNKYNLSFLAYNFRTESFRKDMILLAQGISRYNISKNKVMEIQTFVPKSLDEQSKIGKFLIEVDELITLHQRKLDKLIQLKSSFLDKMFPAEGTVTPKIRFKGFSDAWEQRKCSEIANRFDGQRIPVAEGKRIPGTTPYYGANGIQDYVDGFTHNGEYVLVAEDGANDLKNYPVQYVFGRIWVNNHAHVLQANSDNSTLFLKFLINSTNMESVLVGGGRAKLNANVLMDLNFIIPKKAEQIVISSLFQNLETLITLHQREQSKHF